MVTARLLLERALRIEETAYGPDHPAVADGLNGLAQMLSDLGETVLARPLLERALHIYETAHGPDNPASLRAQQALQQLNATAE